GGATRREGGRAAGARAHRAGRGQHRRLPPVAGAVRAAVRRHGPRPRGVAGLVVPRRLPRDAAEPGLIDTDTRRPYLLLVLGLFTLSTDDVADGTIAASFGAPWRRRVRGWTVCLHASLNRRPPDVVEGEGGDFAAATGTFYYRGRTGLAALGALAADFDGRRFPGDDCRGPFAAILARCGRLFLASDALGAFRIYHDRARRLFSSSFLAVQQAQPRLTLDRQGCWEYAWNGATFGEKTFFDEIRMLRHGMLLAFDPPGVPSVIDEHRVPLAPAPRDFEATARAEVARLRALFATYAAGARRARM